MKPKSLKNKLVFRKQTITDLGKDSLKAVGAGYPESQCHFDSCPYTWDCPPGSDTCLCTGETCESCTTCGGRICDWTYYPNFPC
jgi:hypothetical protein